MKNIPKILTKNLKTGINTVIVDKLPDDVPAMVSKNPDETYTIALNNSYAFERLQQEYLHELMHIENKHFELSADMAEKLVRDIPIKKEPFFYWMYEALAIAEYLREQYEPIRVRKELEAKKKMDAYIESLKNKERKPTKKRRRKKETPRWVLDTRKKLGIYQE